MKVRRRNVKRSKCLMKGMVKDISIRKGGKWMNKCMIRGRKIRK
jgi:hypothetical protein